NCFVRFSFTSIICYFYISMESGCKIAGSFQINFSIKTLLLGLMKHKKICPNGLVAFVISLTFSLAFLSCQSDAELNPQPKTELPDPVKDTIVFVAGIEIVNDITVAKYWKNGVEVS